MVSVIIGNYLLEKGLITYEQFRDLLVEKNRVRVKLGLIAVAEGLMTKEEADRVNNLQAIMDKRFGDIAVERGYLAEGHVETLLKKQGNAYLAFAQALEDQQLMSVDQLEQYMIDYQIENQLTISEIEDLKSGDVDRILPLYIPIGAEKYMNAAGIALRTIMRCVDVEVYPERAFITQSCKAENGAIQYVSGERSVSLGLVGNGQALLRTASVFGKEEFEEVNEDALDAVGELINCISGLYASSLSQGGINLDLLPPEFSTEISEIVSDEMLVLPIDVKGDKMNFIIAIGNKVEMK